jgi:cation diffusion facilitator family transporter
VKLLRSRLAQRVIEAKKGDPEALAKVAAKTAIVVNAILFGAKLFTGITINSMALLADGIDSFFDVLYGVILWFGFDAAFKPADVEHPFGHGRFEHIVTLILATCLTLTGLTVAYSSLQRLWGEPEIQLRDWAIAIVLINLILKAFLVRFSIGLNSAIQSGSIQANSWNLLGDVLSSLVVLFTLILYRFTGFPHLDAAGGLFIATMISSVGIKLLKETSSTLMGQAIHKDEVESLKGLAKEVQGVKGVHAIVWHNYGRRHVVSMHLEIDKRMTVDEAHRISQEVERRILGSQRHIQSIIIHIDPSHKKDTQGKAALP